MKKTLQLNSTPLVPLGDLIELCDERNSEGKYTLDDVRGISIDKKFIFTKADMLGVSLTPYKLVNPNQFSYVTVTSRNGEKISLALNTSDNVFLISSSYEVFKVKDNANLYPEYLYIFFKRSEFDRLSRFNSWGSARETFDFMELCLVKLPLPSLETQQKYVDMYKALQTLAEQNEALIEPLKKSCTAYLANVKSKYKSVRLGDYIEQCNRRNSEGAYTLDDVRGMTVSHQIIPTKANLTRNDLTNFLIVKQKEFIYNPRTHGKQIGLGFNNTGKSFLISWNNIAFKVLDKTKLLPDFLFINLNRSEWDRNACFRSWGSSTEVFAWEEFGRMEIPLPPLDIQQSIVDVYHCAEEARLIAKKARETLKTMCPAVIQKASAEG